MKVLLRPTCPKRHGRNQNGNTIIEVLIAAGLFAVVFLSSMALMESGQRFTKSTLEITSTEDLAQQTLFKIERILANASPILPTTTVGAGGFPAGSTTLGLANSNGFPPSGFVVVNPEGFSEIAEYTTLGANGGPLGGMTRGAQCTVNRNHAGGANVWWAGVAEVMNNPVVGDGTSLELGAETRFRGTGAGFSFRTPVDTTGGTNFIQNNQVTWGSNVRGIGQIEEGRSAIYYDIVRTFDEATENADVNGDGDRVDVFDVGQLRRVNWDVRNPTMDDDVGMGPSVILQEQCNWGGDLDADGFDDPLFLWNPDTNELHVRLFILGETKSGLPIVRRVESFIYLRNQAAI